MRRGPKRINKILKVAQLAVMEAGDFALEEFTKIHTYKEKPATKDIVTAVDIECEKRIVEILRKNFPTHTLLTEERLLPKKLKVMLGGLIHWMEVSRMSLTSPIGESV